MDIKRNDLFKQQVVTNTNIDGNNNGAADKANDKKLNGSVFNEIDDTTDDIATDDLNNDDIGELFGFRKSDAQENKDIAAAQKDAAQQPTTQTTTDEHGIEHTITTYPDGKTVDTFSAKDPQSNIEKKYTKTKNADGSGETVVEWDKPYSGTIIKVKEVLTYAQDGRIISKVKTEDQGNFFGIKTETTNYTYGENGKISEIKTVKKDNDKICSETTEKLTYNDKNQEIKREISQTADTFPIGTKNTWVTTINTEYDEGGNKTKQIKRKENTTKNYLIEETVLEYNSAGKITHKETKKQVPDSTNLAPHSTGKYTTQITDNTFDDNGKILSSKTTGVNDLGNEYAIEYNYENGELISSNRTEIKNGKKIQTKFEGPNLKNRLQGGPKLASEIIEYEADGTTIKQRTVNHFDENGVYIGRDIYDKDNKLLQHDDFKLDGKIDLAMQVSRGDCYLLCAINSLVGTPLEDQVFNQQVETLANPETGKKTYRVKLPGSAKTREALLNGTTGVDGLPKLTDVAIQDYYEITEDELMEAAKLAGKKYSCGDKDVLLMELVYERYRMDVDKTMKANQKYSKILSQVNGLSLNRSNADGDYLNGGLPYDATYVLTGITSDVYQRDLKNNPAPTAYIDAEGGIHVPDENGNIEDPFAKAATELGLGKRSSNSDKYRDELIAKIIEDCKDGKLDNYLVTCGMNISKQVVNGQTIRGGGHAFTITNMTEKEVTLANPWYPDKPIKMSIEDFKKVCTGLFSAPINEGTHIPEPNNPDVPDNPDDPNNPNNPENMPLNDTLQANTKYKVPKGKGYTAMIKEALQAQGIPVNDENIKKAKEQFEAANPNAVHTYTGQRRQWRGNRYLYANDTVIIPKFEIK